MADISFGLLTEFSTHADALREIGRLRDEIEQLRAAGERLSDALYMYSIGTPEFCDSTKTLLAQWEEARRV